MAVKKGGLLHVHIEPLTDQGEAMVHVHKNPAEGRKNAGPWLSDGNSVDRHHAKTPQEAGRHVTQALSDHFGGGTKKAPTPGVKEGKSAAASVEHREGDSMPGPEDGGGVSRDR